MNDLLGFNEVSTTEVVYTNVTPGNFGLDEVPYQPYQEQVPYENQNEQADPFADIDSEHSEISKIKASLEEQIQQRLRAKMDEEWQQKQSRKLAAKQFIEESFSKRNGATQQRKMQNREEEKQEKALKAKAKADLNVWELACKCVELQEQNYPGSKDVSIIRRLILLKKNEKRS